MADGPDPTGYMKAPGSPAYYTQSYQSPTGDYDDGRPELRIHATGADEEGSTGAPPIQLEAVSHEALFEVRDPLTSPFLQSGAEQGLSTPASYGVRRPVFYAIAGVGLVIAAVVVAVCVYAFTRPGPEQSGQPSPFQRSCTVFCNGPLLQAVQSSQLWNDSKTFVDMPLTVDPEDVLAAFSATFGANPLNVSKEELGSFVSQYFTPAGTDTAMWIPDDFVRYPPALLSIQNDTLRNWALGLNDLWVQLGRVIKDDVREYPQRYTLVYQPYGMIVPGGRFLENYFWDSYWIILGLLHSNMAQTAIGMVLNLVHLFDTFGFVPNGARVYYALPGRSQPPMLSHMVRAVYEYTGNVSFLASVYPTLKSEYEWWMQPGNSTHAVNLQVPGATPGSNFTLNRYITHQYTPRPESWLEDVHTAAAAGYAMDDPGAQALYSNIAAAAESGWDFTARWFRDEASISTCDTSDVIPVDLNSILYGVETNLADMADILAQAAVATCSQMNPAFVQAAMAADAASSEHGATACSVNVAHLVSHHMSMMTEAQRQFCTNIMSLTECATPPADTGSSPAGAPAGAGPFGLGGDGPSATLLASATQCSLRFASGAAQDAQHYRAAAAARMQAMDALMWDETSAQWRDLRLTVFPNASRTAVRARLSQAPGVYAVPSNLSSVSNFLPVWAQAYDTRNVTRLQRIVAALQNSTLLQESGVATTAANTTEQWDWPNGWAPLQHMIVLGLNATGFPLAVNLAKEVARRWLRTGLIGYEETSYMFEKYNVLMLGEGGGGGEYIPQTGFGWTNGVALDLLVRYNFFTLEARP